ncbi:MAG TPA: glyoxalase/bleomycin resistance/dioxygenase family protein [Crocinitomicaceae bacterium]|nr:glyoxalase/bleomycin resistance/dioxygenase family protein [Crocinitomicaceae bacterium]
MSQSKFPRMHLSFYVSELAATVNFYNTFFGQPASKVKSGYVKYELDSPGLIISFIENSERVQSNFGHIGIQVGSKEEMEKMLEIAKKQNIVSLEEIGVSCCYAVQDKFWVDDPDGIQWEIYYFHEDVEFNDPKFEREDASACCMPQEKTEDVVKAEEENTCEPGSGCC